MPTKENLRARPFVVLVLLSVSVLLLFTFLGIRNKNQGTVQIIIETNGAAVVVEAVTKTNDGSVVIEEKGASFRMSPISTNQ